MGVSKFFIACKKISLIVPHIWLITWFSVELLKIILSEFWKRFHCFLTTTVNIKKYAILITYSFMNNPFPLPHSLFISCPQDFWSFSLTLVFRNFTTMWHSTFDFFPFIMLGTQQSLSIWKLMSFSYQRSCNFFDNFHPFISYPFLKLQLG